MIMVFRVRACAGKLLLGLGCFLTLPVGDNEATGKPLNLNPIQILVNLNKLIIYLTNFFRFFNLKDNFNRILLFSLLFFAVPRIISSSFLSSKISLQNLNLNSENQLNQQKSTFVKQSIPSSSSVIFLTMQNHD